MTDTPTKAARALLLFAVLTGLCLCAHAIGGR